MSQIKKKHIRSKTIWQIFMMFLEIAVIVGGLTLGSSLLWEFESGLDILERVGLFYGFYQILTYIILSNLNDIKADHLNPIWLYPELEKVIRTNGDQAALSAFNHFE